MLGCARSVVRVERSTAVGRRVAIGKVLLVAEERER